MWEMFSHSAVLFFQGKLFREPNMVLRQWAIAVIVTAALLAVLALIGAPLWLAVIVAALVGGGAQPYLFRDLKYN